MRALIVAAAIAAASSSGSAVANPYVYGPAAPAQQVYATEIPYINITRRGLNVRMGPGVHFPRMVTLPPGEGGYIETCARGGEWCLISFGGWGAKGWVSMRYMRGIAR